MLPDFAQKDTGRTSGAVKHWRKFAHSQETILVPLHLFSNNSESELMVAMSLFSEKKKTKPAAETKVVSVPHPKQQSVPGIMPEISSNKHDSKVAIEKKKESFPKDSWSNDTIVPPRPPATVPTEFSQISSITNFPATSIPHRVDNERTPIGNYQQPNSNIQPNSTLQSNTNVNCFPGPLNYQSAMISSQSTKHSQSGTFSNISSNTSTSNGFLFTSLSSAALLVNEISMKRGQAESCMVSINNLLMSRRVAITQMHKTTRLVSAFEVEFVKLALRAYFILINLKAEESDLEQLLHWTSLHGWAALDESLKGFYGISILAIFQKSKPKKRNVAPANERPETKNTVQENRTFNPLVASQRQHINTNKMYQIKNTIKVDAHTRMEFLRFWFTHRMSWRTALEQPMLTIQTVLALTLLLEKAVALLSKTLTFDKCLKEFTCKLHVPPSYYQLMPGDIVVYDSPRHAYVCEMEKQESSRIRAGLHSKDIVAQVKELKLMGENDKSPMNLVFPYSGCRGFSRVWLGDPPKIAKPIQSSEYQVYAVQYFLGGGEPYCAVTLGPESRKYKRKVPRVLLANQGVSYEGRMRIPGQFCKSEECGKYSLERNFGFCEDHRVPQEPTKSALKKKKAPNIRNEDETCFVCLDGGEIVVCDNPECGKVYHVACLGLEVFPPGEWICPFHSTSLLSQTFLKLLGKLSTNVRSEPFRLPVQGQPGYQDAIQHPMSIRDMRLKALNGEYSRRDQLLEDFQLISTNCKIWCTERYPDLVLQAESFLKLATASLRRIKAELDELETRTTSF